jgi:hypothetical protein
MIIKKSDKRFKRHDVFKIIMMFDDLAEFHRYLRAANELFGFAWNLENPNSRRYFKQDDKWGYYLENRRITLRSDADLTMVLLKCG